MATIGTTATSVSIIVWHRPSPQSIEPMSNSSSKTLSQAEQSNAKLGLRLFVVYLLLYLGFVLINAFSPDTMSNIVFAGLNLAVVYGFGLIVAAFVLALIYGVVCKREPKTPADGDAT